MHDPLARRPGTSAAAPATPLDRRRPAIGPRWASCVAAVLLLAAVPAAAAPPSPPLRAPELGAAPPVASPPPASTLPTVVVLASASQQPLGAQVRLAIQGQLVGAGLRVELHWLQVPPASPEALRPLALRLASRPGVAAVVWFELALRAQAYLMVPRCARLVVRDLEATHARARVESLGIIVGSAVKAVQAASGSGCPVEAPVGAPPPAPPPPPPPPPSPVAPPYARWHLGAAFAADFFWLQTGFHSFKDYQPHVAGMARGSLGVRVELAYALGPRWLFGLTGRVGRTRNDLSENVVLSYEATARLAYTALGGQPGWFSLYLGAELGGGVLFSAVAVGNNNEVDSFEHGAGLLQGVVGVAVSHPRLGWFAELVPGVVFPRQTTFRLLFVTGLRLYL